MKTIHLFKTYFKTAVVGCGVLAGLAVQAATINWTNSASGVWNSAANWNPNTVPGATDTAVITNAGVTVSLNGTTTVGGIMLGTNGTGTATLSLNNQTLSLNGPLTVNASGSFTVDSGALVGNTNAVLHGAIGWTAGIVEGILTLPAGSILNITTANNHDLPNCTFTNNGTVVWNNGAIRSGSSGGTTIYNYGSWDAQSDQQLTTSGYNGATVFNNFATLRKSGGTNSSQTLFTGAVLYNQPSGVLDVQQGNFTLTGSGNFTGGYITTNTTGTTYFSAGNFNLNGTATGSNVIENAGNLVGTTVIKGVLTWVNGNWNGVPTATIPANSTLLILSANNHDFANCIVTNDGTVVWSGGDLRSGGAGTTIYNYGLWDAQSDQQLTTSGYNGATVFNNFATFRKSGGTNSSQTLFTGAVLYNQPSGVLDVQQGNFTLQGSANFTGGYITTNTTGTTYFSAGNFNLNGTATGSNVIENAGNLVGTTVIKGVLTWVNGNWNGVPTATIPANSTLLILSANNHDFANCIVTNDGTVVWSGGDLRSGGAGTTIYNYGLWDAQSDQQLTTSGYNGATVFNNFATFRKSGGTNSSQTLFTGAVLYNQPSGVLDVQQGNFTLQGSANFTGGYITTNTTGTTYFSAGNFNLNGTATGSNVIENAGNLVGTNVINGALNWVNGNWNSVPYMTIPAGSTLLISGPNNHDMANCILTNYGTVVWNNGAIRSGSSSPGTKIYNYGLWDAQSDQQLTTSGYNGATVFNNFATFRKSGGTNPAINTLFASGVLFNQPSGVLDVQVGNVVLQGSANFNGGYITTNTTGKTYFSIGSFNLNGTATGTNVIENAGNLVGVNVIKGALNWVAGSWNGITLTILTNSSVTVSGGAGNNDLANTVITNYGTLAWASGDIRGGASGTALYNYGLWEAQSDHVLTTSGYNGSIVFNNFATFRKSSGSKTSQTLFAGGVFLNQLAGAVDVQQGNLTLQGGGSFAGGTANNPAGAIYLSLGSYNINGTATKNMIENSANLTGVNVINGTLNWVAGSWNGITLTILTNSSVTVSGGAGNNDLANTVITNYGTLAWASGDIRGGASGTALYNYGLWEAQSDHVLTTSGYNGSIVFNNFGTFRKEFTSGSTVFAGGVTFNNNGTMNAQAGNISLQGAYTLANGTKLGFGLGGWLGNGSISLSGAAAFTGSLSVNLNGYFWPGVGNSFNLLNYTSETGVLFTNAVLPPAFTWQTNYNATAFAITVVSRPAFTNATPTNIYSAPISSATLYLAWPGDHTGWKLQSQTNSLTTGIDPANWATLVGSSATNEFFMPIVKTNATVFYRMVSPSP